MRLLALTLHSLRISNYLRVQNEYFFKKWVSDVLSIDVVTGFVRYKEVLMHAFYKVTPV